MKLKQRNKVRKKKHAAAARAESLPGAIGLLTPQMFANQLFDAALLQHPKGAVHAAAVSAMYFLANALAEIACRLADMEKKS